MKKYQMLVFLLENRGDNLDCFKGAGTPPTRPAHAKPIKVAMED